MQFNLFHAIFAGAALLSAGCQNPASYEGAALYHGFSQIDPDRERVTPDAWIVVKGSMIEKVGAGTPPKSAFSERHDMSGLYAMPGLIDAHAHITAGPHKIEIKDGAPAVTIESVDEITKLHARYALAFGVTTVRNPGGDPVANAGYDENIASGAWIGPEAVHAGAVIQPPPFVGSAFAYPQTPEEWRAEAERQAALGMKYFKLYVGLSEDEIAAGVKAADDAGLKAIAHLDKVSWTRAVELGVDGLEHALPTSPDLLEPEAREEYLSGLGPHSKFMYRWFELADFDGPLVQEMISLLAEKQIETNLTLLVNELTYNVDDLTNVWPEAHRRYVHPKNLEAGLGFMKASATGWSEEDFTRARAVMPKVLDFAKRLYDAGVPMMIGTDGYGGTPQYARELELHVKAGIPVWAVLRMATSDTAEILGLSERAGKIANDMEADIVFLRANPVEDVAHVKDVASVLSNGEHYQFDELLSMDE